MLQQLELFYFEELPEPSGLPAVVEFDNHPQYKHLAIAVVLQAIKDGCDGNRSARAWLEGEGRAWLELAGIEVSDERLKRATGRAWADTRRLAAARIRADKNRF